MLPIVIALYYIPLLVSYALNENTNFKKILIGVSIWVPIVVIATHFFVLNKMRDDFYILVIIAFLIIATIFVSVAVALGRWAKSLKSKGKPLDSKLLLAVAILIPIMCWITLSANTARKLNLEQAKKDYYQSLTLAEKLGEEKIYIIISPQIYLSHGCHLYRYGTRSHKACKAAAQYDKDYFVKDIEDRELSGPILYYIEVSPIDESCVANRKGVYRCVSPDEVSTWCNTRVDLDSSIWCTNKMKNRLEYKRYSVPAEHAVNEDTERWKVETIILESQDFLGNQVQVSCSRHRDKGPTERPQTSDTTINSPLNRLCRIKYNIAPDVEVISRFEVTEPEALIPQAQQTYIYSQDFWQDMKTTK